MTTEYFPNVHHIISVFFFFLSVALLVSLLCCLFSQLLAFLSFLLLNPSVTLVWWKLFKCTTQILQRGLANQQAIQVVLSPGYVFILCFSRLLEYP